MNRFPYDGRTDLDPLLLEDLARAHRDVEDLLLGLVQVDPHLRLLAHFDGDLAGQGGQSGTSTGALRFREGRWDGSQAVLVEQAGQNLVANPSAELDLTGWSANDPAVSLSWDSAVACSEQGLVSRSSFKLGGTGLAGPGYVKTSVEVSPNSFYSASAWVHSPEGAKAKLELAFTGGSPLTWTSSAVTAPEGGWHRLKLENRESGSNTACELRLYLVQGAPAFPGGSRLSRFSATSSASVTDTGMALQVGDVVMCAVSANPSGPKRYAWHQVTAAATGVSNPALRLDDSGGSPGFVGQTRLSRWAPSGTVPDMDDTTTLGAGDLVFCRLDGKDFGWHLVTAPGTALSSSLRLDDGPTAPRFASGSRISLFSVSGSALEDDDGLVLNPGDVVFCHTLANPARSGYAWHLVTTGGTGASSPDLRLDDSPGTPDFATGSRLSKLEPGASALVDGTGLGLSPGHLVFCAPTRNPAAGSYNWHMVTAGGTGVSSSSLRLDHCTSQTLYLDAVQLEASGTASTYVDGDQGLGYSGLPGLPSTRAATNLSFGASGVLVGSSGTVGFWVLPFWSSADPEDHVLFEAAENGRRNRLRFSKDAQGRLVLTVYDADAGLRQLVSDAPAGFPAEQWQHLGFTWNEGALSLFLNGQQVAATATGPGSACLDPVPATFFLGSDYQGVVVGGALFDDLVVRDQAFSPSQMAALAAPNAPCRGLALAQGAFGLGTGIHVTDPVAGEPSAVLHGLGVKPSFVQFTERSNGLVYLSGPADSTCFYVKGSAPSLEFDWRAFA